MSELDHWADKRYLIIDNTPVVREMLYASVHKLGAIAIDYAASGDEAIGLLSAYKFDVVFCDNQLGEGRNGQQVLEEARARDLLTPSCVWLMLSSEKSSESVMGAAEHQPDAYLIKPVSEQLLISRMALLWQKKSVFKPMDAPFADKDYLGAAIECETQIARHPEHIVDLLRLKAALLLKHGETGMARDCFERALQEREYQWARAGLAKISMANGEFEQARQMFQGVIDENRHYIEAYDQLAIAHQNLGQPEKACDVLEKAAKLSPNSVVRQQNLGQVSFKLGHIGLAEKAFRKCIKVGQNSFVKSVDAYLGLARVCGRLKDPREALALLTTAQQAFSGSAVALRVKIAEGLVYHESGKQEEARRLAEELEQMLKDGAPRPDMAGCLEMSSLMLAVGMRDAAVDQLCYIAKNNHDNDELLDEVRKVFELGSMSSEGELLIAAARKEATDLMNQGVLLWKSGQLDAAVQWMRSARALLPDNLRILFNAAQIMISHLQQQGFDQALATEAGQILLHVDQIAPGQQRFSLLMEQLAKLVPVTNTGNDSALVA
jgi:tetratricopeptide (TPR) repeat protein